MNLKNISEERLNDCINIYFKKDKIYKDFWVVALQKSLEQPDIHKFEREREDEIRKITIKYDNKIKDLKIALQVNMELNTVCLECKGRGRISFLDAAGDTDYETCPKCRGSRLEPK